jgi:hypothetical protein
MKGGTEMNSGRVVSIVGGILLTGAGLLPVAAQEMPADYREVLTYLSRKGDYGDNVLKLGIPRTDLKVSIAGIPAPTSFGFGGWLAFTPGDMGKDVMMGDLVLLEDEVNPVMSALLENGLEVTALHNHFFWEEPRIFYMHVHGHGNAIDLAHEVKPALDLIGHVQPGGGTGSVKAPGVPSGATTVQAIEGKLDTGTLERIMGHKGDINGPVYKVTIGRDDLQMKEMGAVINSRMGLNTWAAFIGTDDNAAVAGDVAMLETEVPSVLRALRKSGLAIVAIHHHMTGTSPMIIFLHYWGVGTAAHLAAGVRSALDVLGTKKRDMMH